jgi:hypothetical protein
MAAADVDDGRSGRRVEWFVFDLRDLAVPDDQCRIRGNRATRSVRQVGVPQHDDRRCLLSTSESRERNLGDQEQGCFLHGCFRVD